MNPPMGLNPDNTIIAEHRTHAFASDAAGTVRIGPLFRSLGSRCFGSGQTRNPLPNLAVAPYASNPRGREMVGEK